MLNLPDVFTALPVIKAPWDAGAKLSFSPPKQPKSEGSFEIVEKSLKDQFGIELVNAKNAFEAALKLVPNDTQKALWISNNWINDPIVKASFDLHQKTLKSEQALLDKGQLAAKVLELADDPLQDAKDRVAAFKLYSEIAGYTGKVDINNSTNLTLKTINLKFVKPDAKEPIKVIDNQPSQTNVNEFKSPVKIKLVK